MGCCDNPDKVYLWDQFKISHEFEGRKTYTVPHKCKNCGNVELHLRKESDFPDGIKGGGNEKVS